MPSRILKQEADEEKAEIARLSSFIGAIAIGELVKSTLGPKGMDKILVVVGRNEGQVMVLHLFSCLACIFNFVSINLRLR